MATEKKPYCKSLVLDAGPLLSLSPLRGIAESYYTVPQVLAELKDKNAKEHLERLGLNFGIKIEVKNPDPASLASVIQWAKKTGDYAVLSHPDLSVLALTHTLQERAKRDAEIKAKINAVPTSPQDQSTSAELETALESLAIDDTADGPITEDSDGSVVEEGEDTTEREPLNVELLTIEESQPVTSVPTSAPSIDVPLYDDPSDSDDGEGEWITPANVALHKSRALDLLPSGGQEKKGKGRRKEEVVDVGCMTADFAMQNVLMQMGLNLVGTEGKRIQRVKTWVLRCHACFKICKDASKQFCPSCGNPSLIRASVTIASPNASSDAPAMQIHLKPNFQYKLRGTKYSIPAPKPGSAKHGSGEGLILREDQVEYMRAKKRMEGKQEREEARMMKGLLERSAKGEGGVAVGSWMDPDWVPEIISASAGGKGRTTRSNGDLPIIGYGRKNPNERRRNKK
ncbi:Nin one binding Zn-ribbon like-domain-containing protein [Lentinula aff. lateritia]|uniref:Nin one binding Zn-ribbon like-domain-containing protein n=1 Tax=Lentinula aff. lateritia TaxID=2804960 RepID=A0ACC1TTG9_9AGAR|nr:Nin one binding Zn-ribbon like-domain-containing protein [Lentinula aff. lateritia]